MTVDDAGALLRLLQLTDSGFPTGAFSFSHGLEGLVATGWVRNERDIAEVIGTHVREGFAGIECPAMSHAWRAARRDDLPALVEIDGLVDALKPIPVYRNGSIKTGRRLLESSAQIVTGKTIERLRECVRSGEASGHHPVAFGVVMAATGLDQEVASVALGAGFVGGLAAAAVRLGVIGQDAAQRLVAEMHDAVAIAAVRGRARALDDMGAYLPMVDIAGLRQPGLSGRVFAS